jgi:tetratricopeptide (TPR) repeat protein
VPRPSGQCDMEPEPEQNLWARVESKKAEGTVAFKAGDYVTAVEKYEVTLALAEEVRTGVDDVTPEVAAQLLLSLRLNAAAARLKTGELVEALVHCDAALALDARSSKALYRKGQALLGLDQPSSARAALMAAYKLEPKNKPVIALLRKADAATNSAKAEQRSMTRALGGLSDDSNTGGTGQYRQVQAAHTVVASPAAAVDAAGDGAVMPNYAFYSNRREITSIYPWDPGVKLPPLACFSVVSQKTQFVSGAIFAPNLCLESVGLSRIARARTGQRSIADVPGYSRRAARGLRGA